MLLKKKPEQANKATQNGKQKPKKTMAALRLQKDLTQYKQEEISFVKLSFPQEDNLQVIRVEIFVEQNSIYANCLVTFQLQFPDSYPMDPPKLQCLNKIYHPNISYKGRVCLPLVREDFAPTVTLTSIICGLIYILTYPNAQDALNPQIGDLMIKDYEMFRKIVEHTVEGRVFKNLEYDRLVGKRSTREKVEEGRKNEKGNEHKELVMKKIFSEQPQSKEKINLLIKQQRDQEEK